MLKKSQLTPEQKEKLIEMALNTEKGRLALAQAMANPIRNTLDYQGIARKLLVVDPLPQGAIPAYDKDVEASAVVIPKRGAPPVCIIETDRITVPTFEIVSHPKIRFSHIRERRYNVIERAQERARAELMAAEDEAVISAIDTASTLVNPPVVSSGGILSKVALNAAIAEVEKHDIIVTRIIMNPLQYKDLRVWGINEFDPVTAREVLQTGLFGHLWSADILVSRKVPAGQVFVLGDPSFVGVMPIRQDVQVLPADDVPNLYTGWVVYEEIGIAVYNSKAIAKIIIN